MRIESIRFWSFVKLSVLVAASVGFAVAIAMLLGFGLLGGNVSSSIFVVRLDGLVAGIVNLVWGPVMGAGGALIASPVSYPVFVLLLKAFGGVDVDVPVELAGSTSVADDA